MPTLERTRLTVAATLTIFLAAVASAGWLALHPEHLDYAFVPGTLAALCWVAMALSE